MKHPLASIIFCAFLLFSVSESLRAFQINLIGHPANSWSPVGISDGDFDFSTSPGFVEAAENFYNIYYYNNTQFTSLQVGDSINMTLQGQLTGYGAFVSAFVEDPFHLSDGSQILLLQMAWNNSEMYVLTGMGAFDSNTDLDLQASQVLLSAPSADLPNPLDDPLIFDINLTYLLSATNEWQITGSLTVDSISSAILEGPPIVFSTSLMTGVNFYYGLGSINTEGDASDILISSGSISYNAVPEPGAFSMVLFSALVGLWWARRKSWSHAKIRSAFQ